MPSNPLTSGTMLLQLAFGAERVDVTRPVEVPREVRTTSEVSKYLDGKTTHHNRVAVLEAYIAHKDRTKLRPTPTYLDLKLIPLERTYPQYAAAFRQVRRAHGLRQSPVLYPEDEGELPPYEP
ncbi:hypothetical protein Q8F55_008353 [Vanrija albida]|uniref:Uncharacterized protein n=1 Tax=Vanrija albida TaxID=181172 RepID=A0ABR3PW05_9TREE